MSKNNVTLEGLLKRQQQLEARIQMLKAKEATQQRKDDTRRKILVGAYLLEKHQKANSLPLLIKELDTFLFKTHDRALFGLDPKEEQAITHPTQEK